MSLGPAEVLVILVVALLVFGPSRLPEIGRQVGRGLREVRKFQETLRSEMDDVFSTDASDEAEPPPSLPPKSAGEPVGGGGEQRGEEPSSGGDTPPPSPPGATA